MARGIKTGGRIAGTPNKITASVKSILIETFENVGGVETLSEWARDNRTEFYRLWAKLLPQEANIGGSVEVIAEKEVNPIDTARRIAFIFAQAEHNKSIEAKN